MKSSRKEQHARRTVLGQLGLNLATAFVLMLIANRATAFSLLGPYTDWMYQTNGYRQPDDIGGPMNINEEYRWNVPVVTYGFDKSFLDYFGSNGVAAVESAIQILNDLPPASVIVSSNYPFQSQQINYQAESQNLYDLKSATLSVMLEQMGLAQPSRNIFDLRLWNPILLSFIYLNHDPWPDGIIPNNIIERNFDPETLQPSHVVVTGRIKRDHPGSKVVLFGDSKSPTWGFSLVFRHHCY